MLRKSIIALMVVLPMMLFSQQSYKTQHVKNLSDTTSEGAAGYYFNIQDVESDTSKPFHMFDRGSMKFLWNSPDSGLWKAEIYTSPTSTVYDSTYKLAQTIVAAGDTGGVSVAYPVFAHPERFGILIVTGLTGNAIKDSLYGQIIYTGTTSQPGASLSKFSGGL